LLSCRAAACVQDFTLDTIYSRVLLLLLLLLLLR
jgi:hypothetical protein